VLALLNHSVNSEGLQEGKNTEVLFCCVLCIASACQRLTRYRSLYTLYSTCASSWGRPSSQLELSTRWGVLAPWHAVQQPSAANPHAPAGGCKGTKFIPIEIGDCGHVAGGYSSSGGGVSGGPWVENHFRSCVFLCVSRHSFAVKLE
jgi:hypothetical protein